MSGNKMINNLWDVADRSVGHLSITQAVVIGGVGSSASVMSVLTPVFDTTSALQYFTLGMGALGAFLSVGLLVLKFVQQRREMVAWKAQYEREHAQIRTEQVISKIDRSGLHAAQVASDARITDVEKKQAESPPAPVVPAVVPVVVVVPTPQVGNLETNALSKEK